MRRFALDLYSSRDVVAVGDALVAPGGAWDGAHEAVSAARRVPLSAQLRLAWGDDPGLVDRIARVYAAWGSSMRGPHLVPVSARLVVEWPTVTGPMVVVVDEDDADLDLDDVRRVLFAEPAARPPPGFALAVAARLAAAFAEAHASARASVVGAERLRFIPAALRFGWDGAVRLSAWPAVDDERVGPQVAGLPEAEYLSPEELVARDIGPGRDAWVVGVVLHLLLCGATPYGGARLIDTVRAIYEDRRASRTADARPDVAPSVHALVDACLARSAPARPSCDALAALLDDAARAEGFAARDVGATLAQLAPHAWREARAFREALALAPPPDPPLMARAEVVRVLSD